MICGWRKAAVTSLLTTTSMEHLLKSTSHGIAPQRLGKESFQLAFHSSTCFTPTSIGEIFVENLRNPPGIYPVIGSEGSEPWFRTGSTVYFLGWDELLARNGAFDKNTQLWHKSHIFDPKTHIMATLRTIPWYGMIWLPSEQFFSSQVLYSHMFTHLLHTNDLV